MRLYYIISFELLVGDEQKFERNKYRKGCEGEEESTMLGNSREPTYIYLYIFA